MLLRGLLSAAVLILCCCGCCFRQRLQAACGRGGMRPHSTQGQVIVMQNPQASYPGQQPYASYVQPQQQRPAQASAAPASPYGSGGGKQQPPTLGAPKHFAVVTVVTSGSPADIAGLRVGDCVVSMCGARSFKDVGPCLARCEETRSAPASELLRGGASVMIYCSPHAGSGWAGRLGATIVESDDE